MLELKGRGAIVAGTRRIGATVVRRLAREGVHLAIVYRSSRDVADELYASIRADVERACVIQADLASPPDVSRLVDEAQRQLGDLSFCIDAAFDYPRTPYASLTAADWDHAMASAKGAYLLALASSRAMQRNAGPTRGHVVLFGDWAAEESPSSSRPTAFSSTRFPRDRRLKIRLSYRAPNGRPRSRRPLCTANRPRKRWRRW